MVQIFGRAQETASSGYAAQVEQLRSDASGVGTRKVDQNTVENLNAISSLQSKVDSQLRRRSEIGSETTNSIKLKLYK